MSLTCGDLIKRGRALYGPQTALVFEDRRFTFAEQASRIFRLANALLGKGLRKQERIAVLARNCSEYIECFGAGEVAGVEGPPERRAQRNVGGHEHVGVGEQLLEAVDVSGGRWGRTVPFPSAPVSGPRPDWSCCGAASWPRPRPGCARR